MGSPCVVAAVDRNEIRFAAEPSVQPEEAQEICIGRPSLRLLQEVPFGLENEPLKLGLVCSSCKHVVRVHLGASFPGFAISFLAPLENGALAGAMGTDIGTRHRPGDAKQR